MDWNKLKQAGAQVADSAMRTAGTLYEKGKKEARLVALNRSWAAPSASLARLCIRCAAPAKRTKPL